MIDRDILDRGVGKELAPITISLSVEGPEVLIVATVPVKGRPTPRYEVRRLSRINRGAKADTLGADVNRMMADIGEVAVRDALGLPPQGGATMLELFEGLQPRKKRTP